MLSTRTARPLKPLALALALAALAVPTAQGKVPPAGVPLITEHSASQNGNGQPSTPGSVWFITEHSAGQNGNGQPSTAESVSFITEHSAGQNGTGEPRSIAASVPAAAPNAFDWGDAGVGAGVAFAAVLFAAGVATLIVRRGRGRLAGF
jgi:hypothetical protein